MKSIFCLIVHLFLMQGLALKAFDLYAWGYNGVGQVGDGTVITRTSPVNISSNSDWLIFKCGVVHTAAIKTDGTLWAWGFNSVGQLGDGSTTDKHEPVQAGTDTDWAHVSCGWLHTVAIKKNGTLWAWGDNFWGQIGDGTKTNRINPVKIGSSTDWVDVVCGETHNLAIKKDGTLWAWGDNHYGKLGDGTTNNKSSPVKIGNDNDWVKVAGGGHHSIAIKSDGSLWAWGFNYWGQLGDNTTIDRYSPVQVGSDNNWKIIECGKNHSFAIKEDGTLWAWGYNGQGRLGDGTNTSRHSPVQIGMDSDWFNIDGGDLHSIGVKNEGSIWTWGYNNVGQLGDGTTTDRYSPNQVGTSKQWANVSCGSRYSVCLLGIAIPNIATSSITDVTSNSAMCGGSVLNDGGRDIIARGVCWASTENPTLEDNFTIDGADIGDFTSFITGLINNTEYYVRAYATNVVGTSYGEQQTFKTHDKHQILLSQGWNLISSYISPNPTSLEDIFSEIEGSTVIIKNNSGQIYYPEFEINDIGNWDMKQAYQVYMSKAETLTISGMKIIPETTEIALATGWNMLAYLRDNVMDIEIALAPLVADEKLVIAKDNMGNVFYPAFEINMIGDMLPGQGYQIYLLSNDTLVYPEN